LQHEYAIHFVEMVYGFYKAGAPTGSGEKNSPANFGDTFWMAKGAE
jgi:hypothetical protein